MKSKKTKPKKIIYYSDELNDDFAGMNIKPNKVDSKFKFIHENPIWRFFSFIIYYFIAVPIVWVYEVLLFRVKFVNKKAVKKLKKQKCYFYGNHIGILDAFTPNLISLPTKNKILVSPETVSIKGIRGLVQMLGAIPVPDSIDGMKKFVKAIDYYHKNHNITIYPEAHIWNYYTGVRNFKDSSFAYPINHNAPVIAFFTAFSEPKGFLSCFRKANATIYISDPIYPDLTMPKKVAQRELRDKVYNFMLQASKNSTYSVIEYKHVSEKPTEEITN